MSSKYNKALVCIEEIRRRLNCEARMRTRNLSIQIVHVRILATEAIVAANIFYTDHHGREIRKRINSFWYKFL